MKELNDYPYFSLIKRRFVRESNEAVCNYDIMNLRFVRISKMRGAEDETDRSLLM